MPDRTIVTGMVIVILMAFLVFIVEFFIPLSAKSNMDLECRNMLIKMEVEGSLSTDERKNLQDELTSRGFTNIVINSTAGTKQGQKMNLHVDADYTYSKLTGIFTRSDVTQHMVYNKFVISRKVAN